MDIKIAIGKVRIKYIWKYWKEIEKEMEKKKEEEVEIIQENEDTSENFS